MVLGRFWLWCNSVFGILENLFRLKSDSLIQSAPWNRGRSWSHLPEDVFLTQQQQQLATKKHRKYKFSRSRVLGKLETLWKFKNYTINKRREVHKGRNMEHNLASLLQGAGVSVEWLDQQQEARNNNDVEDHNINHSNKQRLVDQMEAWLGLTSSTSTALHQNGLLQQQSSFLPTTAEDCAPLSKDVYHAWRRLLIQAWWQQPQCSSSSSLSLSSMSQQQSHHTNLLLESTISPEDISLAHVWDSIRVTRWLMAFLDLPLDTLPSTTNNDKDNDDDDMDDEEQDWSGTSPNCRLDYHWVMLLRLENDKDGKDDDDPDSSSSSSPKLLIQALYHHIQQLPVLQAQLHAYTHSLQQPLQQQQQRHHKQPRQQQGHHRLGSSHQDNDDHDGGTESHEQSSRQRQQQDYAKRLDALSLSQTVAARLLQEWERHCQHELQPLLALWYRASSAALRAYTRMCLGEVWTQYLRRNSGTTRTAWTTSTTVMRHENTQAASLRLTLNILQVILQGRQGRQDDDKNNEDEDSSSSSINNNNNNNNSRQAVVEHLLVQFLIPLHQTNALVLWRDQTPLLSLYHEPLTQCIASIIAPPSFTNNTTIRRGIGGYPHLLPELLHALIQADIFPVAGYTNKQVLLLHELDTYLGLFAVSSNATNNDNNINNSNSSSGDNAKKSVLHESLRSLLPHNGGEDKSEKTAVSSSSSSSTTPPPACSWWMDVCRVVARCMASDHSGLAEQALQLVRNAVFCELVQKQAHHCLPLFLQALVPTTRTNRPHNNNLVLSWNPTVRKMTYLVLDKFHQMIPTQIFQQAANHAFSYTLSSSSSSSRRQFSSENKNYVTTNEESRATTTTSQNSAPRGHQKSHGGRRSTAKKGPLLPPSFSVKSQSKINRPPSSSSSSSLFGTPMKMPSSGGGSGGILGTSWKPPPVSGVDRRNIPSSSRAMGGDGDNHSTTMPPPPALPRRPGGGGGGGVGRGGAAQPPVTITGVAPWAVSSSSNNNKIPTSGTPAPWRLPRKPLQSTTVSSKTPSNSSFPSSTTTLQQKRALLQTTGVAETNESTGEVDHLAGVASELSGISEQGIDEDAEELEEESTVAADEAMDTLPGSLTGQTIQHDEKGGDDLSSTRSVDEASATSKTDSPQATSSFETTGYNLVLEYMELIKPPEDEAEGGASSWSKAQMAETPTLLHNLKFHDLVFGHDLGTGSFGTVRYARLIERNKTRSKWPEYAVKIVSMEKIRALGYEASIRREIAVLHMLSHPGIARLISSFRFREGTVYLVLEYASRGDLYTLLRQQGSLDHDATRFVTGELVAALTSIHNLGLVYGDLKPENIVITELGHVKLTDFGGCRPVTMEATERIQTMARTCLTNLRNGDWKEEEEKNKANKEALLEEEDDVDEDQESTLDDMNEAGAELEEDVRVEGTTTYLPPEVVFGAYPTQAADSWALGCVLFQCLSGRPPHLDVDDEATRQRIVTFAEDNDSSLATLFQDRHSSGISLVARDLIQTTFTRDIGQRPDMYAIARHEFFTSAEVDVFALHQQVASPLDVGNVTAPNSSQQQGTEDTQWARRQYSSIWAPQPPKYNLTSTMKDDSRKHKTALAALASSPIPEGEEASAFFAVHKRLQQR